MFEFYLYMFVSFLLSQAKASPELVEVEAEPFSCTDGAIIARNFMCDGIPDCNDEVDESPGVCGRSNCEFRCKQSGDCIKLYQVCNYVPDCGGTDHSDEEDCQSVPSTCRAGEEPCADDPATCYSNDDICDGFDYCNDRSDEVNCSRRVLDAGISSPAETAATTHAGSVAPTTTTATTTAPLTSSSKKSRGKKGRRRKGKKGIRMFYKKFCKSWGKCAKKQKKKIMRKGFKKCMRKPSHAICRWRPVNRFVVRKCSSKSLRKKFIARCAAFLRKDNRR